MRRRSPERRRRTSVRTLAGLTLIASAGPMASAAAGATGATGAAGAAVPTAMAAAAAPGRPSDPVLDAAVDLRLDRVLEEVLAEPDRDPVQRAVYRVRMARAEVAAAVAASVPASVLAERVETLLTRSASLVDTFPDHPLAGSWRLDRAEDVWRWQWTLEAAGVRTLLGVPDRATRRRAIRAADVLRREVRAAASALDVAIERLEFDPGWPEDPALVREHRRLAEEERDGRLPRLQAIALALDVLAPALEARGGAEAPAAPMAGEVDRAVAALAAAEAGLVGAEGAPPVGAAAAAGAAFARLRGHVLVRAGRGEDAMAAFDAAAELAARGEDAFGSAVARMGSLAAAARYGASDARRGALDRLVTVAAGDAGDGPGPAGMPPTPGLEDFLALLAADAAARGVLEPAGTPSAVLAAGLRGWSRLAERGPGWLAIVRPRVAAEAPVIVAADDPPPSPAIRLGIADAALAAGRPDGAREDFLRVAGDPAAPPFIRAAAWQAIAGMESAAGRARRAARATLAAAVVEPDAARATGLLDAALRLAAATDAGGALDADARSDWPWPPAADPANEADPLAAAVAEAVRRHPSLESLDRWRTLLATRLLETGRRAEAAATLAEVPADASEAPVAAAARVAIARDRLRSAVAAAEVNTDTGTSTARDSPADSPPVATGRSRAARAAAVADAAAALLEDVATARRLAAPGGDAAEVLARRLGGGRDAVLEAEAHLAVGRPERVLAVLGLGDGAGAASEPGPRPSSASPPPPRLGPATIAEFDAAARPAAADLALRATLAIIAERPDAPVADPLAAIAAASPAAARRLVLELERRLDALIEADHPLDDPARVAAARRTVAPLAAGVAEWLRAVPPPGLADDGAVDADDDGGDGDDDAAETLRRLRAVAFRAVGRAELASGRHARAAEWFDALGGLRASDPAVLLGAAECRLAAERAAIDAGHPVDADAFGEAMSAWRRLAGNRSAAGERRWWIAQLRMLEVLELVGRRTDTIAPRIQRLRLEDPELGGPGLKPAFEALAARHGG